MLINREGFFGVPIGLIDSTAAAQASLEVAGLEVVVLPELVGLSTSFGLPAVIWVSNGTFPDSNPLTAADGAVLVEFLTAGTSVVYDGTNYFNGAPLTPFEDYNGIDELTGGISEANAGIVGVAAPPIDLSPYSAAYTPENGIFGIPGLYEELVPTTTDLAGPDSYTIWEAGGVPGFSWGVFYDTEPGFGKVITTSLEIGGYEGDRNAVVQTYLDSLGTSPTGPRYLRGDANGDFSFTALLDALFILNFGFVAGSPEPPCLAAADGNGDGSFTALLDGLYLLNFGFVGGSPSPPAPFPNCAADPITPLPCDIPCP